MSDTVFQLQEEDGAQAQSRLIQGAGMDGAGRELYVRHTGCRSRPPVNAASFKKAGRPELAAALKMVYNAVVSA